MEIIAIRTRYGIAIDLNNNNNNDNNNNNFHRKMLTCSQVLRSFLNVVTKVA